MDCCNSILSVCYRQPAVATAILAIKNGGSGSETEFGDEAISRPVCSRLNTEITVDEAEIQVDDTEFTGDKGGNVSVKVLRAYVEKEFGENAEVAVLDSADGARILCVVVLRKQSQHMTMLLCNLASGLVRDHPWISACQMQLPDKRLLHFKEGNSVPSCLFSSLLESPW